jgi:low affinity Fe/Cu permease
MSQKPARSRDRNRNERDANPGQAEAQANGQPAKGYPNPEAKSDGGWFHWFALETSRLSGRPGTFALAAAVVLAWGVTGPLFNFSDTWQLVINTGTTIVTFLMVFLIQHTQNRDTLALQVKLSELILAVHGAKNRLATAEDLSDEELEALHKMYCERAVEAMDSLNARRGGAGKH